MKFLLLGALGLLSGGLWGLEAPPLSLGPGDLVVEARADGYHLWIRQVPGAASVLLTEAFEPADHRLATYALRAVDTNPVNDKERRLLNGKDLPPNHRSLVSSSPVPRAGVGQAFEVVVPRVVEYGSSTNPNSRFGRIDVQKALGTPSGTFWFSARLFARPYADYRGAYRDNAFELKSLLVQTPQPSADRYEPGLESGFARLGPTHKVNGIAEALRYLQDSLDGGGDSLDVVVVLDTTKSMQVNLKAVQDGLLGPLREEFAKYRTARLGLVLYRDYLEEYLTRATAFTSDLNQVQADLNRARAEGGGDIPEAVVEGLAAAVNQFAWSAARRVVFVLGDAPQHPAPRGNVTEAQVRAQAEAKNLEIQLILLPQTLLPPGS